MKLSRGSASNWTREIGYRGRVGPDTYPRLALRSGLKYGFAMLVALRKIDQEFVCRVS